MPKRHNWKPNEDGDCTKCPLPEANRVHAAPHVVIVDRYDPKGKQTSVVGPFDNKHRAMSYAESLTESMYATVITDIKPLKGAAA